jgi:hypothetical protein
LLAPFIKGSGKSTSEVRRQAFGRNTLDNSLQIVNRKLLDLFNCMNYFRRLYVGIWTLSARPISHRRWRWRRPLMGKSMAVIIKDGSAKAPSIALEQGITLVPVMVMIIDPAVKREDRRELTSDRGLVRIS